MPLASSKPHEDISIDVLSPRIVIWAMDLLCHGSVLMKAAIDGGVAIRPEPVIRGVLMKAVVGFNYVMRGNELSYE
jgi:hypothetical protein